MTLQPGKEYFAVGQERGLVELGNNQLASAIRGRKATLAVWVSIDDSCRS
jgi:hypothetical protein